MMGISSKKREKEAPEMKRDTLHRHSFSPFETAIVSSKIRSGNLPIKIYRRKYDKKEYFDQGKWRAS